MAGPSVGDLLLGFFFTSNLPQKSEKKQQIRKKGQTKKFSAAPTAKEQRSILSRWSEVPGRRSIIIKKKKRCSDTILHSLAKKNITENSEGELFSRVFATENFERK